MQNITAYLYRNFIHCQLPDDTISHTRSKVVYSAPVKIYKNVDNPIMVVFRNNDERRISIVGMTFEFALFGTNSSVKNTLVTSNTAFTELPDSLPDITVPLMTKSLTNADISTTASKGLAKLVLTAADIALLTPDSYTFSIRATMADGSKLPVYCDDNYSVAGTMILGDNVYPVIPPT